MILVYSFRRMSWGVGRREGSGHLFEIPEGVKQELESPRGGRGVSDVYLEAYSVLLRAHGLVLLWEYRVATLMIKL